MKIVYLHQYFTTPEMSGGTRSFEMARRWVAAGHEVHVVTAARNLGDQREWTTTVSEGILVHSRGIPYSNAMSFLARLRAFFVFVAVAGPRARLLDGDVVFATSTPLTIILPAVYAAALRAVPIVFEVRDLWPQMPIATGVLRNPILKALARALERFAYGASKRIVTLSEGMAQGVESCGVPRWKITVAPNSCDIDAFDIDEGSGRLYRESNSWLSDRPFVVYCGTIGPMNNLGYLVRLAACMSTIDSRVVFAIYGAGKEEPYVRELAHISETLDVNLFMMGELPKRDIPSVLSAATVVTSMFLPLVEMQANSANKFFDGLAAARPIAINYGGWQAALITSTGAGIVLDANDPSEAARQLAQLLSDADGLAAARLAARKLAHGTYSRDRISKLVLSTIEDAVLSRPSES